jgi:arginyl-tRNA synthetase
MNLITHTLDQHFRAAIQQAFDLESDPLIVPSQNPQFGDYQSNAAMGLAKKVTEKTGEKTNPRAIAEKIKAHLKLDGVATEISIAGPGFINVRLDPTWLASLANQLLADARLGMPLASKPDTVVVDYPSHNVAKEMHIGHLKPSVIGDCLARVMEFAGHKVERLNHWGDWGTSLGMLLAYLKLADNSADAALSDIEKLYRAAKAKTDADPAFAEEGRQCVVRLQSYAPEEMARWEKIMEISRLHADEMFSLMGLTVNRSHERGESFYNNQLASTVKLLKDKGIAVDSEGAVIVWVPGYEAPLMVQKSDGAFGYATTDLASVLYRVTDLHATRLVYLTDDRQKQHFAQVFYTAEKAGWLDGVAHEHAYFGTICGSDGKPIKTKSGESVKLKDVLLEAIDRGAQVVASKSPDMPADQQRAIALAVGIGSVKYFDLLHDRTTNYVFDWESMLALQGNTAPYLQYAHARVCSIFRTGNVARGTCKVTELNHSAEGALVKQLLRFTEAVASVARELKPHLLCAYLFDLSGKFSSFYTECPVLKSDEPSRSSRLALCDLTARTIQKGLNLLGIEAPEQM